MSIRISYAAIDAAVQDIENQIQVIRDAKGSMDELPFGKNKKSSGPFVKKLNVITCTELEGVADALIALMENTNDFLREAKRVWINTDNSIAN